MIFIRGCKRCGGTLVPDEDNRFGEFYSCLACGSYVERQGGFRFAGPSLAQATIRIGPDGKQQRRPSHRGSGL